MRILFCATGTKAAPWVGGLREALPHHIVLSKLPLVRFCQPNDPGEVQFWYDLLGTNHVGFAICSANGRVLAASSSWRSTRGRRWGRRTL
jgi:hypothetical protein